MFCPSWSRRLHNHPLLLLCTYIKGAYPVIRFVATRNQCYTVFGTCIVVSVNGTLVEDKMRSFKGECSHFSFNKFPIYTYNGASAKFSTNSHETDMRRLTFFCRLIWLPPSPSSPLPPTTYREERLRERVGWWLSCLCVHRGRGIGAKIRRQLFKKHKSLDFFIITTTVYML